jgi:hypothetical protein
MIRQNGSDIYSICTFLGFQMVKNGTDQGLVGPDLELKILSGQVFVLSRRSE